MMGHFQTRVFFGGAKREMMESAFGKVFPRGSRLLFCWKRAGWESDNRTWREFLWGMWLKPEGDEDDHRIYLGLAERYGKRRQDKGTIERMSHWVPRVDPGNRFNATKEIERVARSYDTYQMPIEVAQGYIHALTRVVELERRWAGEVFDMAPLPWELPITIGGTNGAGSDGEGEEDVTGVRTATISRN